jgi:hypothetical protein
MRFRTTLLLIVLNLITFFFLLRQESPFEINPLSDTSVLGILPRGLEQLSGISVEGSQQEEAYSIERDGDSWKIVQPFEWIANPFAVRRMLARMESTRTSIRFKLSEIQERDQSLADFGLDEPVLTVDLSFDDEVFRYRFGAPVEIGNKMYLLSPDSEEIWVVDSTILRPFLIEMENLRSENLFSIPVFEVRSLLVEFADDDDRRRFTRKEDRWIIDAPFVANGNLERVESSIDGLIRQSVSIIESVDESQVIPDNFNTYARFELVGNRRSSTLLVGQYTVNGQPNPDLFLGRFEGSDTTFLIPSVVIDWWREAHMVLRERRIFDFDPELITAFEVETISDSLDRLRLLKLENNQWKAYSGENSLQAVDYSVDVEVILTQLSRLSDLVALQFYSDSPTQEELIELGLTEPTMRVLVEGDSQKSLIVGATVNGVDRYVKLDDSDSVYVVASDVLETLGTDPLDYRLRRLQLDETVFNYFEIEELETGRIITNAQPGSLQSTAFQELDAEDAEAAERSILAQFNEFKAGEFLAGDFSDEGFQENGITVPWAFKLRLSANSDFSASYDIWMSKRLAGSRQYAFLEKQALGVNFRQELIDSLFPLIQPLELPEEYRPPENLEETADPEGLDADTTVGVNA